MALGRTSNPAFRKMADFSAYSHDYSQSMTAQGTANKTLFLLTILILPAAYAWAQVMNGASSALYIGTGAIGGIIFALITSFKPKWSNITAPIYAALEGLALGGLSAILEFSYPGIAFQAIAMTFGTLFIMLLAYKSGFIKATEKFKMGVVAATGGVAMIYLATWILSMFGIYLPLLHNGSLFSIGFSIVVIIIAALNLVLDFDFIEQGERSGAPKYMEWFAAFGLMVTLVWLYIEFLKLLAKLSSRD